ncbi:MAG: transglutaminase domain protein [Myxococcales bacterium]|nr:transglutaminase domain protein [Myxococcales bacterium]
MRFAVAHKAATFLVVGFAYLAMIAGGGVSPIISLAGLVGLAGSWWWEPPLIRYERWSWVWTTASIFALVYSILTAFLTGDFLGVGAQFLIWLVVAKAYNRRAARDWQQMYLLAFLMLVAGSVLNADLTYGLCFLGFVISATWALTLFHLRREMEDNLLVKHAADRASERVEVRRILDSKRIVGARFFAGTGLLSFAVFVASAVVFLALPRVGFGFFLKSRGGLTLSGFSDGVKLGGHGVIKNDATIVMRVEIDPKVGGRDRPEIHWRGVAFDRYSHGQWSRSESAPDTNEVVDWPNAAIERHTLAWRDAPNPSSPDALQRTGVRQDVWLDPLDSDVLFGASNPRVVELSQVVRQRPKRRMKNDELRVEHGSTIHYTVWSQLAGPTPDELRSATGRLPASYAVYLRNPPEITSETLRLALEITAGSTNNYDKAVAIQRYLTTNLTYTLELEEPKGEPVDYFLFHRKKGHCEYFASAFAVLARAAKIPTRQVNGFLGGEWNEYQGYVAVRAGDAHSWDEVFFPGAGWVTFDATPSDHEDVLGRGGSGWRAKMSRFLDTLRFQWSKWVIEYDLVAQLSLFKSVGAALKDAAGSLRDVFLSAERAVAGHWPISVLVIALVVGFAALRRRRPAAMASGRSAPRAHKRSTVAQVYDQVARQLAKAGIGREVATTPRELAQRMTRDRKPAAAQVGELIELYYAAEWGLRREETAERRAAELAVEIRQALGAARS